VRPVHYLLAAKLAQRRRRGIISTASSSLQSMAKPQGSLQTDIGLFVRMQMLTLPEVGQRSLFPGAPSKL
jgi:hypothetical protein